MQCPKCHSENTQRLEVVYQSGTHNISTNSETVGASYSGRIGAGAAHTETSGTSQSMLAGKASPPPKQTMGFAIVMVIVGVLCLQGGVMWKLIGLLVGGGGIYFIHLARQFNSQVWPELYQTWLESWMCHKCGTIYHQP
jgi:hypothetical protein